MFSEKSDSEKLRYVFENFGGSMHAVAERVLNDSHLAEDVVQEVLIKVTRPDIMEKIANMDDKARKAYLLITTKNMAVNFYVKRKREGEVTIPEYNEEAVNNIPTEDCAEIVIRKMEEEAFFNIVNGISSKYSYVLISKYKYEFSDKQIASMCNVSEATIRKRLERGRKMLLERLEKRHYLEENSRHYGRGGK